MKKISSHIATVIKEVTDQPIILGGHDWGGWFVWRLTLYYPELIRGVFSFCVPYRPPRPVKVTLEQLVEKLPNWRYQLQISSGGTENIIQKSPERLRGFLNSLYGGRTPEGQPGFSTSVGIIEENIDIIGPSPLVSKDIMDFYVQEYSRHGLHAPCNWYRTRELESEDETVLAKEQPDFKFKLPAMLVMAEQDAALPLQMADGQEEYFEGDNFKMEVLAGANHWAMLQKPEECNKLIGGFVKKVLGDDLKASL
ncbi:putative epoxide hydrolase protein [Eutypa lata UCREL1]|uniref:Putative epoxide hydrolase protein n=1 Tax=Eutypa lata (strain UCR-EL1) TaxID=1287681 RepID=M7STT9_EUTLA|nr:putative epoxide hydrolase protein [Eutypa lata UCREL1]